MVAEASLARMYLPFDNGDVMTRAGFQALYSACEDLERVELIEGVVYLPSPIPLKGHGGEQGMALAWLIAYEARHPGEQAMPPITLKLDDQNEVAPDAMLVRGEPPVDEEGYMAKVPELVVEVAGSSHARDLHQKKRAHERNGVAEYIPWDTRDGVIHWFQLEGDAYHELEPVDGRLESAQFPGLVMDVAAMLAGDRAAVVKELG